jgi:hypothetical protein
MVDRVTPKRIIPITPIMRRYQALRKMPQAQRLAEAERLVDNPAELAQEFAASVERFRPYRNVNDHFYPPARAKRQFAEEVKRTNDLVLRLADQGELVPVESRTRVRVHAPESSVIAVPAQKLAMTYVDRELLVQRTTSPAEWEDGTHNRGGVRLDLLLADATDCTPVIGELKLPGDMDPFFALIQALACAAHLATPNQYERMRRHLHRGTFPEPTEAPRVDASVLFVNPAGHNPAQPPKGRYMARLHAAADALAPKLLSHNSLTAAVRRITALDLALSETGEVTAEVRWAWARDVN